MKRKRPDIKNNNNDNVSLVLHMNDFRFYVEIFVSTNLLYYYIMAARQDNEYQYILRTIYTLRLYRGPWKGFLSKSVYRPKSDRQYSTAVYAV